MLGWHYRSRSESLISFSNAAFYQGRLLTVPEQTLPGGGGRPIDTAQPDVEGLLSRAVSFHLISGGAYEKRRNAKEADYIAGLTRGLLARGAGMSIGIVAFSEAQQAEIHDALERLARRDPEFRKRLDAELEREEDGQFVGLLVKNLENIQGDERDVMILSICYGPDAEGRMRMNFGPINQSGGEGGSTSRSRAPSATWRSWRPFGTRASPTSTTTAPDACGTICGTRRQSLEATRPRRSR